MIALWLAWTAFVLSPQADEPVTVEHGLSAEPSYQWVLEGNRLTKVYE